MRFALATLTGVLLVVHLPAWHPGWLVAMSLPPLIICSVRRRHWWLLGLCLGFASAGLAVQQRLAQRLPPDWHGDDVKVTGRIVSLPDRAADHVRFLFAPDHPGPDLPPRIRLSWYHPDRHVAAGEHWVFAVRLKPPHGTLDPPLFDYARWLFAHGIGATGYVRYPRLAERLSGAGDGLLHWRSQLDARLHARLAGDPLVGVLAAIAVGDRSAITQAQWQVFRRTGTAHLMAISGLHIGMLAGLAGWLTLWLWPWLPRLRRVPALTAAAWAAVLAGGAYAGLAGLSIATVRAWWMVAIGALALSQRRALRPYQVLALALTAILVFNPLAVLGAGFWLSFAAVTWIVFLFAGRAGARRGRWWRVQLGLMLGLAPLTLAVFGTASPTGLVANLLAIPLFTFLIVPLTLAGVLTPWHALLDVAAWLLHGAWWGLQQLAALDLPWHFGKPPLWAAVLALIGVALLLLPRAVPGKLAGLVLAAAVAIPLQAAPEPGMARITVLDVGQGLSAVIRTHSHVLIYDSGPGFGAGSDAGKRIVVPWLRARGLRPDVLLSSHGDRDHVGGRQSLELAYSGLAELGGQGVADATACRAGRHWRWDGVVFRILSPTGPTRTENAGSCVLQVAAGGARMLLPGDIEAGAEHKLVARLGARLRSGVLLVPHHGSRSSSTAALLDAVKPRWAVIPAGWRNRFHFPAASVVKRYRDAGVRVVTVGTAGATTIILGESGARLPDRARADHARLWRGGQ